MHIDVHGLKGQGQMQHAQGESSDHDPLFAGFLQGVCQQIAADQAAIQNKGLMGAIAPGQVAYANIALQQHAVHVSADLVQFFQCAQAIYTQHGAFQLAVSGAEIHVFPIGDVPEGDLGMGQDEAHHQIGNISGLRGRLFEKFAANGGVVEKILDGEAGAFRAGSLFDFAHYAAVVLGGYAIFRSMHAGGAVHLGHRGNGSQCLSAEAQRANAIQVIRLGDLAGGVAGKGKTDIAGLNA